MAKKNKKRLNSEGKVKKVNRQSPKRKEKKRESNLLKYAAYNNMKAEKQQSKDMMARQAALEAMGLPVEQQEFGFEDHKTLYNFAQERAPFNQPPIKFIDASVAPPETMSYPEYPRPEFSSPPAFDINGAVTKVALKSKQETVRKQETAPNASETRDVARLGRAKKIFHFSRA